MADFLSRSETIGDFYTELTDDSIQDPVDIAALEQVSLQTLSPKALAESQALCPEVKCHADGNGPKSVVMKPHVIDGYSILCEASNDNFRPMIPRELREIIIQTFHALGHPNAKETGRRISEFYYWPKLKAEVTKFVKECHPCQAVKPGRILPGMGAFPKADKRFANLHIDVVGPLPESHGFKYILTVLDRATKHYEAIPMKEATSEACCLAFLHGWIQRYGLCETN